MSDIKTRPFSKNYSGLANQTVIALCITIICVGGQEYMKRKRRGRGLHSPSPGLGSKETWEFGYLYNGRSWARFPSPTSPIGWPLSWVKQVVFFPEDKLLQLRGLDATVYIRFLRGCFFFALAHLVTTFPILFPIHVHFSDPTIPTKSMTRASISSLVATAKGRSLLWIHICLLFWVTLSWMGTLFWICNGTFKLRAAKIQQTAQKVETDKGDDIDPDTTYYQAPHPQYPFHEIPSQERDKPVPGLRLRTVMVSNVPHALRTEKELREYFEYYMSRKIEKPAMGLTSSTQPGLINKSVAFLFNRVKRLPAHLPQNLVNRGSQETNSEEGQATEERDSRRNSRAITQPLIERVVIARKMTELASLLERREEILTLLEAAHIKLANKTLLGVKTVIERKAANKPVEPGYSKAVEVARRRRSQAVVDVEQVAPEEDIDQHERLEQLVDVMGPFVEEFGTQRPLTTRSKKVVSRTSRQAFQKLRPHHTSINGSDNSHSPVENDYPLTPTEKAVNEHKEDTIWDALLSLPRTTLEPYQPLINLRLLFKGQLVPAIDYYTSKLNLLTALITENRAKAVADYDPTSTAFVTFADPVDARRACKYLAVHPNNPMACLVTMAPVYQDIDWIRVMKSSFKGEFLKDWVVNAGVWGFTVFWLFPVSLLVGLVSIQNISLFWPSLKRYLEHHEFQSEVLQSLIPTLLVAGLALLIPLILLLIAKKAHTITTLSALHDLIMTRYYKFLICNVLVFFCVGTAAMQTILQSLASFNQNTVLNIITESFPTAGPFYVGWLIFTTAMHGGFELALIGLPLMTYPITKRQVTPRKRTVGLRPRTLNFYYWLPNHCLVIHVILLFSLLNPFVLPFGTLYFFVLTGVIKNQLIHVYAKNYEGDGKLLLIRIVRYSLDGLILTQVVFLGYMAALKKTANLALSALLIFFTVVVKLVITRMCRAQFELDDITESEIICRGRRPGETVIEIPDSEDLVTNNIDPERLDHGRPPKVSPLTIKLPHWINFSYRTLQRGGRFRFNQQRQAIPFSSNQPPADRGSQSHVINNTEELLSTPKVNQTSAPEGFPWDKAIAESTPKDIVPVPRIQVGPRSVEPHPPPIPWDDQDLVDLPYDNPFYTRVFDDTLWLPRNPAGVLDLDDTVDMRISITVEEALGRLGTWLGAPEVSSPGELSQISQPDLLSPEPILNSPNIRVPIPLPEVDGTEAIDLPPAIAKRVQAGEKDVEQTLRPRKSSILPKKLSNNDQGNLGVGSIGRRRPSILDRPPGSPQPSQYRSLSGSSAATMNAAMRGRSGSILSALQIPPGPNMAELNRTRTLSEHQSGVRPDTHAQAEFVIANTSASHLSLATPKRSQNVSAAQAIFHEVVEEERAALQQRMEEETAEVQSQISVDRSWLTSWMYWKA